MEVNYRIRYERGTVILTRTVEEADVPAETSVISFVVEGVLRVVRVLRVGPVVEIIDDGGHLKRRVEVEGVVMDAILRK